LAQSSKIRNENFGQEFEWDGGNLFFLAITHSSQVHVLFLWYMDPFQDSATVRSTFVSSDISLSVGLYLAHFPGITWFCFSHVTSGDTGVHHFVGVIHLLRVKKTYVLYIDITW